jgi:hypothetical protein
MYHTNKYSSSLQSLTILFIDLIGIIPARVYIYIHRPSLPTVHFYGGVAGSWFYVIVHLFISPWIINSERFHFNVLYILVF